MFFARIRLAAATALLAAATGACGDDLGLPPANFENVVDTTVLFALQGTPIGAPSSFDIVTRSASRTDLGQPFDLAFDIDPDAGPLVYPSTALGIESAAGLQPSDRGFDQIERAPTDGYDMENPLPVQAGTVFLGRSRASGDFCAFLGSLPRFGKFRVLAVDIQARTLTFEHLINANCGFRDLTPGFPSQ